MAARHRWRRGTPGGRLCRDHSAPRPTRRFLPHRSRRFGMGERSFGSSRAVRGRRYPSISARRFLLDAQHGPPEFDRRRPCSSSLTWPLGGFHSWSTKASADPSGYSSSAAISAVTFGSEAFLAGPDDAAIHHLNAVGTGLWNLLDKGINELEAVAVLHGAFPREPSAGMTINGSGEDGSLAVAAGTSGIAVSAVTISLALAVVVAFRGLFLAQPLRRRPPFRPRQRQTASPLGSSARQCGCRRRGCE
jgi:hypothetical protein